MNSLEPFDARQAVSLRRYDAERRSALLDFRRSLLGAKSEAADPDHVAWLYERRPEPPALLWMAQSGEQLLGHAGVLATRLDVDGKTRRAGWLFDALVDPEHDCRNALAASCGRDLPINLTFAASRYRRMLTAAGFVAAFPISSYVRVLRPAAFLASRHRRGAGWSALGLASAAWFQAIDALIALNIAASGLVLHEVDRFDADVDALTAAVAQGHRVMARRDAAALNLRFVDHAGGARYQRFYLRRSGCVLGYIVIRAERATRTGFVVDYACAPEHSWLLLAHGLRALARSGVHSVVCWHTSAGGERALRQLGFARRRSSVWLMHRTADADVHADATLGDANAWFVTGYDGDLDLPTGPSAFSAGAQRLPIKPARLRVVRNVTGRSE